MGSSCYAAYYYQDLKEWYIYGSESDGRVSVLKPYVNEFTDHLHKNAIHLFDLLIPYPRNSTCRTIPQVSAKRLMIVCLV